MNDAQIRKLQSLTRNIDRYYGPAAKMSDAPVTFTAETLPGGQVLFSATNNNDLRWYETCYTFHAFIGPRGGVRQYEGNIRAALLAY
jgi:hypothetical protein